MQVMNAKQLNGAHQQLLGAVNALHALRRERGGTTARQAAVATIAAHRAHNRLNALAQQVRALEGALRAELEYLRVHGVEYDTAPTPDALAAAYRQLNG